MVKSYVVTFRLSKAILGRMYRRAKALTRERGGVEVTRSQLVRKLILAALDQMDAQDKERQ